MTHTGKVYNSLTCRDCPKFRRLTCLVACREMNEVFDKIDQEVRGTRSSFLLRIFDRDFKEVDVIEGQLASTLLEMGKMLQKTFDCYYRLEYIDRRPRN